MAVSEFFFFFLATNRWFLEISVAFIQADERESLELNKLAPSTAHLMGEKWNHTHWKYRFNNSREEKNKHIKKLWVQYVQALEMSLWGTPWET